MKVESFEEIAYQTWLSENFVMTGFRKVFEAALAEKKYSDANTALTQMGKKLGMFVERTKGEFKWDGDFGSLDAEQLAMAKASLMRDAIAAGLAPGGRLTLLSGDVIEATAEPAADAPVGGSVQVGPEV